MKRFINEYVEKYAGHHSSGESALLRELVAVTKARTLYPQMQVGHLEGAFLRFMVRASKARRILEIGTFTGYSALVMAEGLPPSGKLITCDIDKKNTRIAKKFWRRSPHGRKIQLKIGPALQTLKKLKGPFDLAFIDADKENYIHYWEAIVPKINKGGILLVDNVLWSGRVLKPKDETDHAIADFNRHVLQDSRVESVMVTVRDGITLAWKK